MNHKPITIYHGKDNYFIKKKIIKLKESIEKTSKKFCELTHFDGKHEISISEIIALLQSPPLPFAPLNSSEFKDSSKTFLENHQQIVIIWNYEKIFTEKTLSSLIEEIDTNHAFLISANLDKKKKLSNNFLKTYQSHIDHQWEWFINYKKNQIRLKNFFEENQFKASIETIDYLIRYFQKKAEQIVDSQIDLMDAEFEKMILFFPKKTTITPEKISFIIDELQEERNEFEIMDAFFSKNLKLTLKNLLIFLKNSGDLNSLTNRFIYEITQIIKFKEMVLEQKEISFIFKTLSYRFEIQQKKMTLRHSLFSFKTILTLLDDFSKIDYILKTENLTNPSATKSRIQLKAKLALEKTILIHLGNH